MTTRHEVGEGRMDLLVERCLVVELTAVERFTEVHVAQAISYLKAAGHPLALLINCNVPVLLRGVKRVGRRRRLDARRGRSAPRQGRHRRRAGASRHPAPCWPQRIADPAWQPRRPPLTRAELYEPGTRQVTVLDRSSRNPGSAHVPSGETRPPEQRWSTDRAVCDSARRTALRGRSGGPLMSLTVEMSPGYSRC
ncbi:GxxExxY protein [Sorangium sp. So ce291]|uniref:GxxExxY protein n=1 Tax=Sorangium sp. So ce291 TaxID=3133294 RepID=UPI003F645CE7